MKITQTIFYIIIVLIVSHLNAEIRLPAIISDNMVIQQNTNVPIWGWGKPGENIIIKGSWQESVTSTTTDVNGKWLVKLKSPVAGGPYEITIRGENEIVLKNILSGEVWFASGQSNMAMGLKSTENAEKEISVAKYPDIRLFHVARTSSAEPQKDCIGSWLECSSESIAQFSAVAYYFGRKIQEKIKVPIGLISSSKGGSPIESWISEDTLKSNSEFGALYKMWKKKETDYPQQKKQYMLDYNSWVIEKDNAESNAEPIPDQPEMPYEVKDIEIRHHRRPGHLYNAMVAPIIPFSIKGVIWYQGENNVPRPYQYQELFPALVKSWRKIWQQSNFPFYFVQIAPHIKRENPHESFLMEAQMKALDIPKTGMVVTTDIGNINDNHPKNKRDVGERLALWALANTYGFENITFSGPLYKSYKIEGDGIRIFFDYAESGLYCKDDSLSYFEICSADKKFVKADAVIDGSTIIVKNKSIENPQAVRFGWKEKGNLNLFNKEGLPAAPFRTDNWNILKSDIENK